MSSPICLLTTVVFFFLLLNFTSSAAADPAPPVNNGPSPPSGPGGPAGPGPSCQFAPPSGCGPDTTSPTYNACLVRDHSVTQFIQCADQRPTIGTDDTGSTPLDAAGVLASAVTIPDCRKCNIGQAFSGFASRPDKSEKLVNYLCGKLGDGDMCCLQGCIGTRQPEHGLKGICNNDDIDLYDNAGLSCGVSGGGGGGRGGSGGGGGGSGQDNGASDGDDDNGDEEGGEGGSASASASASETPTATVPATAAATSPAPTLDATAPPSGTPTPTPTSPGPLKSAATAIPPGLLSAIMTVAATACIGFILARAGTV